ncbi:MAG: zinc ABC transporter substrate-binding protein [Gammaproteobacteria bacterium]|nr:zinc ABC transporter substrate-binding protein [Gammaproteobacteria bacterium]
MHSSYIRHLFLTGLLLSFVSPGSVIAKTPKILVTIKPVHSLVSALTQNITQPELLIDGFQSPHDFSLKPSQRRTMAEMDFIIYTSPAIESFISGIYTATDQQRLIKLADTPQLTTLEARSLHSHGHHHDKDGHIWLSTENAKRIAEYLAQQFIAFDPEHKLQYQQNRQRLLNRLDTLQQNIKQQLKNVRTRPFIIFHDAYQYFENEFGLVSAQFVTTSPEHQPGIQQIRHLRQQIKTQKIQCVFYEPPQIPKVINTITEGSAVQLIPLEPLGVEFESGANLYFQLLETTASRLQHCLQTQP